MRTTSEGSAGGNLDDDGLDHAVQCSSVPTQPEAAHGPKVGHHGCSCQRAKSSLHGERLVRILRDPSCATSAG